MFSAKLILTALAFAVVASAAPSSSVKLTQRDATTVTVCIHDNPPFDCIALPVVSDECISLIGGLDRYNDELSWAQVPSGYICEFFEDFGCTGDIAALQPGNWDLFNTRGNMRKPDGKGKKEKDKRHDGSHTPCVCLARTRNEHRRTAAQTTADICEYHRPGLAVAILSTGENGARQGRMSAGEVVPAAGGGLVVATDAHVVPLSMSKFLGKAQRGPNWE
ncbi:hypothetical protein GGX14DRAFT_571716 [Mycena pura]|uniref:Ecp2 effector protein domain-containing protein n=1 Tax=Mycena pura TaxID=153505 RepID=A0AAD6V3C0_9AGAR|nr:hypothetical protein GGX14DRAFT_571716 [Mycena pura]